MDSGRRPSGSEFLCPVCGWESAAEPWGPDGRAPTFDPCDCCGVEWGYQDSSEQGTRNYREKWLATGANWSSPRWRWTNPKWRGVQPDGLTTRQRLDRIGIVLPEDWVDSSPDYAADPQNPV